MRAFFIVSLRDQGNRNGHGHDFFLQGVVFLMLMKELYEHRQFCALGDLIVGCGLM